MKILIVDDDATNRLLLREQLESDGFEIAEAADGAEALERLNGEDFAAVVSDILMPRVDGYRLCYEVRRSDRLRHLPFIVHTATYTSTGDEKLALELGADLFLRKPISAAEITDAVRRVVQSPPRARHAITLPEEYRLLKEYNARLVAKLEDRNIELARRSEELERSEERFRLLAENVDEIFWITDSTGTQVQYVSPPFERIWGHRSEELYASPTMWMDSVHPADRERVREAFAARLRTGDYNEEYRIVRPDGSIRWIADRAFPVRDGSGEVTRIVGVSHDITRRKEIEAHALRAQRMEAIGKLAGGISHDLNNILAPLLMVGPLLRDIIPASERTDVLTIIESSTKRGADLVRQLLQFARGADGQRMTIQVRHLINELWPLMRETFPRNIELVKEGAASPWSIEADASQIHQVLLNLCVNARDAMPDGGILTVETRNVELGAADVSRIADARPGRFVELVVRDTGCGIPPEVRERIFEPFFTTKAGKGTGLGLATVHDIVKGHGGFHAVDSQPGRGTAFRIYLPAAEADAPLAVAEPASPLLLGNGELVLVVDDEAAIRDVAERILNKGGYRVLLAENGAVALNLFLRQRDEIHVVVTDAMMPEMDGVSLARSLRWLRRGLPIIVSTGETEEAKIVEFAALDVTEVLIKPYAPRRLLEAIGRQLAAPAIVTSG